MNRIAPQKVLLLALLLTLSGCLEPEPSESNQDLEFAQDSCDFEYPDGRPIPCDQEAQVERLSAVPTGAMCVRRVDEMLDVYMDYINERSVLALTLDEPRDSWAVVSLLWRPQSGPMQVGTAAWLTQPGVDYIDPAMVPEGDMQVEAAVFSISVVLHEGTQTSSLSFRPVWTTYVEESEYGQQVKVSRFVILEVETPEGTRFVQPYKAIDLFGDGSFMYSPAGGQYALDEGSIEVTINQIDNVGSGWAMVSPTNSSCR